MSDSLSFSDPDECADPSLNDCDENAICENVHLSFSCTCMDGFADAGHPGGAGRNCLDKRNRTNYVEIAVRENSETVAKQGVAIGELEAKFNTDTRELKTDAHELKTDAQKLKTDMDLKDTVSFALIAVLIISVIALILKDTLIRWKLDRKAGFRDEV